MLLSRPAQANGSPATLRPFMRLWCYLENSSFFQEASAGYQASEALASITKPRPRLSTRKPHPLLPLSHQLFVLLFWP